MDDAVTFRNPGSVAPPIGAYSHVAAVAPGAGLLFISGQVGMAPDGTVPPGAADQYELAMRNIVEILRSEGSSPADLVKLTTYVVRDLPADRMRAMRTAILGDARPASTLVYVAALAAEKYLVEVEAVAVRRAPP